MEQENRPQRNALLVDHRDGVGIDGHRPLPAPEDRQPAQRLHAGADGGVHRAIGFADGMPFFVGQAQQLGLPRLAAKAGGGHAGQALRPAVPQGDAARHVDKRHGVVHVVQQTALKHRIDRRMHVGGRGAQFPAGRRALWIERLQPAIGHFAANRDRVFLVKVGELPDQIGIELRAGTLEQLGDRPLLRSGRAVDVVGDHRVEGLDDGDHPRPAGNLAAATRKIAAAAVKPGRHVVGNLQRVRRAATAAENFQTHLASTGHHRRFVRVEQAGLQQNMVRRRSRRCRAAERRFQWRRARLRKGPAASPTPNKSAPPARRVRRWRHSCTATPQTDRPPHPAASARAGRQPPR